MYNIKNKYSILKETIVYIFIVNLQKQLIWLNNMKKILRRKP